MFKNYHIHRAVLKWLILCSLIVMTTQLLLDGNIPPLKQAKKKTFVQIREALNAVSHPTTEPSTATYSYTGDRILFSRPQACEDQLKIEVIRFGGVKEFSRDYSPEELTAEIDFRVDFLTSGIFLLKVRCENFEMTRLFIR
ncbi:MAG: hypothetical protein SF052_25520 [Bacteroidia bacterium]|nr:hypothetical protein [Bacteroidia bacterium]